LNNERWVDLTGYTRSSTGLHRLGNETVAILNEQKGGTT
jgi:hypothetical protein